MRDLIKIIDNFKGRKVCVIGDLMLDKYIYGEVERISPEAPIPVVKISSELFTPGGAGNVANNIATLGGLAYIVGIVGKDKPGDQLLLEFNNRYINTEGIILDEAKTTIEKMRIIARGQHMIRVDREDGRYVNKTQENKILKFIKTNIEYFDILVVSDYVKGLITRSLSLKLINITHQYNKLLVVDTKPVHANYFKNFYLITPNLKEAKEMTGLANINTMGRRIQKQLNCNVLITQGAQGMTLFEGQKIRHFPAKAKEVFDVAGAGDTVIAAVALSLASGADLEMAANIANHAAGITVGKVGTATVSIEELKKDIIENGNN